MTISVSSVDETMPPIIGTAILCITSEPAPVLQRIGTSPAMIAVTVIIFGRRRTPAPGTIRAVLSKTLRETRSEGSDGRGPYWTAIVEHIDDPGSFESDYVTITNLQRSFLQTHPWSLSGRDAAKSYAVPRVITYSELLDEAEAALGDRLALIVEEIKSAPDFSALDPRDSSLRLVHGIHRHLPDQSPKAVVFFSPPYYPHISIDGNDEKGTKLAQAVACAVNEAKEKLGYEIVIKRFYPYISDLSYCKLPTDSGAIEALVSRTRRTLADAGSNVMIETVRGVGYMLKDKG